MAAAHLAAAYGETPPAGLAVVRRNAAQWDTVLAVARAGVNSPLTSSAGRLFDAVAAILGVRDAINYEGQAAVELEQLADPAVRDGYAVGLTGSGPFTVEGADLIRAVVDDLTAGTAVSTVASRFHHGVARSIAAGAARVREETGLGTVALSGGVFQNLLLLDATTDLLQHNGFRVLTHHRVPTNDGGLSLGQAAVALAQDAGGRTTDSAR
jgi:hydrogenase maturation protein HypF